LTLVDLRTPIVLAPLQIMVPRDLSAYAKDDHN
jgi:hypothetical protein